MIDSGYDDILDDYVLTSNIVGVLSIGYENDQSPINDLTGIEDFTALTNLSLYSINSQVWM